MSQALGPPFLFGKLPAHGDFISRGLQDGPRQAWDDWASQALERLDAASSDFAEAHTAIPPWRFIAGPSRLGQGWRVGALAPSVDGAGRRFVIVAGFAGCDPGAAAGRGLVLAALAEDALYKALGERLTADQTVAVLGEAAAECEEDGRAAALLAAAPSGPGVWWTAGVGARAGAEPPVDLLALAGQAWSQEATA
jgi:type VI secretion system ImpM family protein